MQRTIPSAKHFTLFAAIIALTLPLSAPTVLAQAPETTDPTLQQALAPLAPGTTVRISRISAWLKAHCSASTAMTSYSM